MKKNQKKESYWRGHVEAVRASGLTRKAYCAEHQLKLSTLYRWSSRLKRSAQRASGGTWIPVAISEEKSSGIDLRIGGITVEIKPGFDRALLVEVLQTIRTVC